MAADDPLQITIDGRTYNADSLTFREQRELRRLARELVEDPTGDLEDMALMDVIPVLVYLLIRREDPEFTLEQALDMKLSDLLPTDQGEPRPTAAEELAAASAT